MAIVIGCDLHTRFQPVAVLNTDTGEIEQHRIEHAGEAVREFYQRWPPPLRVGVESTGGVVWMQQLMAEMGHELVVGDAAKLRAMVVRRQKTDQRDAEHLALVLARGDFPRIWMPSPEQRDLRHLLLHRHRLVRIRTQIKNSLHGLAMSYRLCRKSRLFTPAGRIELAALPLATFASLRRQEMLELHDQLDASITVLDRRLAPMVEASEPARRLATHPGVGPITALAWVCIIGAGVERFPNSAKLCSYLGLIPTEASSAGRQRLGAISKQGNSFLRFLLVEAAQTAVRGDPELGRTYRRLSAAKGRPIAKVAVARKLAVRMYWMSRRGVDYSGLRTVAAHAD